MYSNMLKTYWKNILNDVVPIQETVTKNGVRLYNINEEQILQSFMSVFLRIIYLSLVGPSYISVYCFKQPMYPAPLIIIEF